MQLVPESQQRKEYSSHVLRPDSDFIARLEPFYQFALLHVAASNAAIMDDPLTQFSNIAPKIMAHMFCNTLINDFLSAFAWVEMPFGDDIFSVQIIFPEVVE